MKKIEDFPENVVHKYFEFGKKEINILGSVCNWYISSYDLYNVFIRKGVEKARAALEQITNIRYAKTFEKDQEYYYHESVVLKWLKSLYTNKDEKLEIAQDLMVELLECINNLNESKLTEYLKKMKLENEELKKGTCVVM